LSGEIEAPDLVDVVTASLKRIVGSSTIAICSSSSGVGGCSKSTQATLHITIHPVPILPVLAPSRVLVLANPNNARPRPTSHPPNLTVWWFVKRDFDFDNNKEGKKTVYVFKNKHKGV
jgi:hypothetical protein